MMKLFTLFVVSIMLVFTSIAQGSYQSNFRKQKFPQQWLLEKVTHTAPIAASTVNILSSNLGAISAAAVTVSTFNSQPDVPRNIVVTPGGTTADIAAGNVVITGTDIHGNTISESLAILANGSTALTGSKAFRSVESISFPGEDSPYTASWTVGVGTKLGLSGCLDGAGWYLKGLVDGVDLTGSTVAADVDEVSKNTIIPNPAPDAARSFDLLFFPNYACY